MLRANRALLLLWGFTVKVREKLEQLGQALDLDLVSAARLISKVSRAVCDASSTSSWV